MADQFIIARGPGKLALQDATSGEDLTSEACAGPFVPSVDGSQLYVATADAVDVYNTQAPYTKVGSIPEPGVVLIALSPQGGWLITCQKPQKSADGEIAKNLKVWNATTLEPVFKYSLKTVSKDAWPALSWSNDDSAFAVAVPNAAHVFNASDSFASFTKVVIKGLASLSLCPTTLHGRLIAGFIPEAKGSPASVGLYDAGSAGEPQPRVKKAFFRTQGAKLMWNAPGNALLVMSFADFDVTNQSYYGEQKLHYIPADPAKADAATTVALPKDGPVHDVQWAPTGDYFLTVAGFMPAKATLWDSQCRPIFDFGSGPYNMVRWNPFGRFIALAGFGNLPGDILLFDKKASGTCKQMGAARLPSVSMEWSPDGRHIMIATTAPRLRVDNKTQILTYTAEPVKVVQYDTLFEAAWLPAPPGKYQHRAPSPERLAASATASGRNAPAAAMPAPKAAGYVPPHLRGGGGVPGAAPAAASFSLGFDANDKGGKIAAGARTAVAGAPKNAVPGFVPASTSEASGSKSASKNAKKRAKKKATANGGEGGEGDSEGEQTQGSGQASTSQQGSGVQQATQEMAGLSTGDGGQDGEGGQDAAKRIRNLKKKLTQIQQIKDRVAKEGDSFLTPEQKQKLQSEGGVLAELKSLGA